MPILERTDTSFNESLDMSASTDSPSHTRRQISVLSPEGSLAFVRSDRPGHSASTHSVSNVLQQARGNEEDSEKGGEDSEDSHIKQAVMPLWAQLFDSFSALELVLGRYFSERQIINLVKNEYEKALKNANNSLHSEDRITIDISNLQRLLRAALGRVSSPIGIDYLVLTEMLAPDLLSRRVLALYCVCKDKNAEGVCIAELQDALALGKISDEVLEVRYM
jgi:hypothetical protein